MSVNWTFDVEARLCEVEVTAELDRWEQNAFLTGCAVSNRLVLTCAHSLGDGVPPLGAATIVRKDALGSVVASGSASTVFVNAELDVRLLSSEIEWNLRPARWGMANGPEDLTAQLWGYPWASIRGDQNGTYAAEVTIKGAPSAAPHRQLTTDLDPRSTNAKNAGPDPGWLGISGGPVVASGCLVGMLAAADGSYHALRMITAPAMLAAADDTSGETLRDVIWRLSRDEVVASNQGLLIPCPVRPVGGPADGEAVRLEPPVLPPLRIPLRSMEALNYRNAVVPYVSGDPIEPAPDDPQFIGQDPEPPQSADGGVEQALDEILEGDERFRAVVLTGFGGIGKSRAAQELMVRAAPQGWTVGLLRAGDPGVWTGDGQPPETNLLVVVDYPEQRPGEVGRWMGWAHSITGDSDKRVRLVLLSRHRRSFGQALFEATELDASDVESLGRKSLGDEAELAARAADRFTELGLMADASAAAGSSFETTLSVLGAVLFGGATEEEVAERILRREAEFWASHLVPRDSALHPLDDDLAKEIRQGVRRSVAAMSLGGIASKGDACDRLTFFGFSSDAAEQLASGFAGLYGDGWAPLQPDPMADLLISELPIEQVVSACLSTRPELQSEVWVVLARAVRSSPLDSGWPTAVNQVLEGHLKVIGAEVVVAAQASMDRMLTLRSVTALADLVLALPWPDVAALQAFEHALEADGIPIRAPIQHLAAAIDQVEVRLARARAAEDRAYEPDLAMALNNLAIRLSETGDRAGAVAPAQEAVTLYRAQPAENRAYEPSLAMALNTIANMLSQTGDRAGAVAPAKEAVTLRRAQAAENRAYEPDLAMALNNLAIRLSETGDRAGAVAPAKEAVTLYRAQPAENRAYEPNLAATLNTIANMLSQTGDRAGAVAPAKEAVTLYRAQAAENRAYEPDLAATLSNLALRLSGTGDRAGAVAPAQEAVTLYRAQAAENRAYEPDLAMALNTLAVMLSETGDRAGAVAPAQEAVTLRRAQAAENRAYEPDLATALSNLALRLSGTGDLAGAVAPAQEAVILYRAQAAENRAYEPDLAATLTNLAVLLSETGDRAGAVAPAQEAVILYRAQAAENRAYEPDLAMALTNLAVRLSETGDLAGAVAPAQEAVTLYRAQAAENRACEPNLAATLTTLAVTLSQTGDRAGAVAPAKEAVTLRRAQAAENRAYEPDLAMALNNLANRLSETGDRAGAVAPAKEAVELYERLVIDEPFRQPNLEWAQKTLDGLIDGPE